jgi:hypothetical protein
MSHEILRISEQIVEDPVLIHSMKLLFDWSNKKGLDGKKVNNLRLIHSNEGYIHLVCDIHEKE